MEPNKDEAEESYIPRWLELLILTWQAHFMCPSKKMKPNQCIIPQNEATPSYMTTQKNFLNLIILLCEVLNLIR